MSNYRRNINDIYFIFPRKQDLTFHANCLNMKNVSVGRLLKILPRVLSVKYASIEIAYHLVNC